MKPSGIGTSATLPTCLRGWLFFLLVCLSQGAWAAYSTEARHGLAWLSAQVQADGSLSNESAALVTPLQARSAAHDALRALATAPTSLTAAIAAEPDDNTEFLSRVVVAVSGAGQDTSAAIASLTSRQNADGGFGGAEGVASNALDTAWALLALKAAGSSTGVPGALAYLQGIQAADGAFGVADQPRTYVTAVALSALRAHASQYALSASTAKATAWLNGQRNLDGGWEGSPHLTAAAYLAVHDFVSLEPLASQVRSFLLAAQASDGSWEGADPFATALVLRALVASQTAPADPALASVTGMAIDAQTHAPLNGVVATIAGGQFSAQSTTVSGVFQFKELAPGSYAVTLSLADYGTLSTQVSLASGQALDLGALPLTKTATMTTGIIQGTVRDALSGAPIAGVTVSLTGIPPTAVTSDAGSYQINGVAPGTVQITASKGGYTTVAGIGQLVAGGQLLFSPVMAPGSENDTAIRGKVTRADTGAALAGVQIVASGAHTATATTDASGEYLITGLVPGNVNVAASLPREEEKLLWLPLASDLNDLSGHAVAVHGQTRIVNGATYFDGTGDYLWIDDTPEFSLSSQDFVIEFDVRLDDVSGRFGVAGQNDWTGGHQAWQVWGQDGTLSAGFWLDQVPAPLYGSLGPVIAGTEYHVRIERTGGSITLQRDGVTQATIIAGNFALEDSAYHIGLGCIGEYVSEPANTPYGTLMKGYLRDFRMSLITGYKTVSTSATLADGTTLFFSPALQLAGTTDPGTSTVSGTVRDAVDDAPLEGVRVVSGSETVYTGADGRFEVTKSGEIAFSKSGYIGGALTYESAGSALLSRRDVGNIRLLRENYEGALLPDLLVLGIDTTALQVNPQTLVTEGRVGITVDNFGNAPNTAETQVALYEDTDGDGQVGTADKSLGSAVLPAGIEPDGQAVRLEINVAFFTRAFRNSRLLAVVDGGQKVTEVREDNNLAPTSCLKPFPFVDDFNDRVYDGWTAIEASSNDVRTIENGVLVVYPKNSLSAHWTGDLNWTDYTAEVSLRFPNGANNDAGIQYRQLGTAIHSGCTFRIKANHARLVCSSGSVVAEAPFTVDTNRWYQLRTEVTGNRVQAFIDNQRIFDYSGLLNSHGAVGLQEDGGVKVEYDNLRVFGPASPGPADVSASQLRLIDKGVDGVELKVLVGNGGGQPVPAGTNIAFFTGAPEDGGSLLGVVALPDALGPGSRKELGLALAAGIAGASEVVAIADHDGSNPGNLSECDKANNRISLAVTAENITPSFAFGVTTDRSTYPAATPVLISATATNTGSLAAVAKARFSIETADGAVQVADLTAAGPATVAAGGQAALTTTWNTGNLYTGRYAVAARFLDAADRQIGHERALFDVVASCAGASCATMQVGAALRSDKTAYQGRDVARLSERVSNLTQNQNLEGLSAITRVMAPDGTELWSHSTAVPQLLAGASRDLTYDVPLGQAAAGGHMATLEVLDRQGERLALATAPFTVQSTALSGGGLTGTLHADPAQVPAGQAVVISATVGNGGNGDVAALPLTLAVLDPATEVVIAQWPYQADIPRGQTFMLARDWAAEGPPGTPYVAVLTATVAGQDKLLAQATVRVGEAAPAPVLLNLTPATLHASRLLGLVSCGPGNKGPGAVDTAAESLCSGARAAWLSSFLAGSGIEQRITTQGEDFANELYCGRHNLYWISGGAKKLSNALAEELRETVRRGEGLLVDGAHDRPNQSLDNVLGVIYGYNERVLPGGDHPVALQSPLYPEHTLASSGLAQIYSVQAGQVRALFPTAANRPAIITRDFGQGRAALATFDLVASLQDVIGWSDHLLATLDHTAPLPPLAYTGGARVQPALTVGNAGRATGVSVTAELPPGARLDGIPAGASLDADGRPVWQFSLAPGETREIALALWAPYLSGDHAVAFRVATQESGAPQPYGEALAHFSVHAADTTGVAVVAAIRALNPARQSLRATRDQAATATLAGLGQLQQGLNAEALSRFLAAANGLLSFTDGSAQTAALGVAHLIAEAEARLCPANQP